MKSVQVQHQPSPKDNATVAAIRAQAAPFKGAMGSPLARPAYDAMIDAVPAAADVTHEAGTVGGVNGFWCRPQDARTDAVLLYLHGGAYILGSASAYRHFAGQFAARAGMATFVADYALAPERPFPAAVEDARAAYHGLHANGFNAIGLVGDSAGGGLALVTLALAQADALAGKGVAPRCCVVMSPWTDLALTGSSYATRAEEDPFVTMGMLKSCAEQYLGSQHPGEPMVSPLYGALGGMAPTQVHVGTSEVLLDDSLRYAERARAQGGSATVHVWQNMPHVFPSNLGALDAAQEAMDIMGDFLVQHLQH